ncbi:hypothetical protein [Bradyrhizobium sp. DASA03120]|uniref:hypothetical protein n=1 Tax=Bradyrhizobium sp. SMVTL-02 TaxID=3395917 RepID=UPI003F72EF9D
MADLRATIIISMRSEEASKFPAMHICAIEASGHDVHEFVRQSSRRFWVKRYDNRHILTHFAASAPDRRKSSCECAKPCDDEIRAIGKVGGRQEVTCDSSILLEKTAMRIGYFGIIALCPCFARRVKARHGMSA